MTESTARMNLSMRNRWRLGALAVMLAAGVTVPATAQQPVDPPQHRKLDNAVHAAIDAGRDARAIVRFADEAARARGAQIVRSRGGNIRRSSGPLSALSISVDAATIETLAQDPAVVRISVDAEVWPLDSPADDTPAPAWPDTWSGGATVGQSGHGVAVAVIDSGVQPHPDLPASRIRAFVDFVNGRTEPYDDFGHGTHVAGIVAGSVADSADLAEPYARVAQAADIVALKVLDATGAGRTSDVIAALEWVLANSRTYNIRVVNLSLGHPVFESSATDPLVQAAEALARRGIVVVAAAGNLGTDPRTGRIAYGGVASPANGALVIAVGAVDTRGTDTRRDDGVTDYSSRGPARIDLRAKPDLVAPGHRIVSLAAPGSTLFNEYPQLRVGAAGEAEPAYFRLSGTSMASPAVARTAALILEANPRLPAATVRMLLEFTSQELPATDRLTQGAGYLNAVGAVRLASLVNPRRPLGAFWLGQPVLPAAADTLDGEQVLWGRTVVWGTRVLSGGSAYVHLAAWDDSVIWGQALDNIVWGTADNIVWGTSVRAHADNIVWGNADNIVWGTSDNIVWGNSDNIVWGISDNIVWGISDNIVWGTSDNIVWTENIVWSDEIARPYWADNIVWGFWADNIVWGNVTRQLFESGNIVWGTAWLDNIVWGTSDNIVWGNDVRWGPGYDALDNIVWGNVTGGQR